jgi:hypothetical protein
MGPPEKKAAIRIETVLRLPNRSRKLALERGPGYDIGGGLCKHLAGKWSTVAIDFDLWPICRIFSECYIGFFAKSSSK